MTGSQATPSDATASADALAISAALDFVALHGGEGRVNWITEVEPRSQTAAGIDRILAEQGTDAAARVAGILACAQIEPTPEALLALLPEPLALVVGELLPACIRLLSLDSVTIDAAAGRGPETLRRMTLAMAGDVRVILVRLAAGLHGLRLASGALERDDGAVPAPARARAREAQAILAPLANRLGLFHLKWEIEDLAFRLIDPDRYRSLAASVAGRRAEREAVVVAASVTLAAALEEAGIRATVAGRPKHLYSIAQKMRQKDLALEQLHDLLGLRVLVATVGDCYAALDVVHGCWQPVASEFDDYISRPKPNGYQSLHTVVVGDDGRSLEVQIRTRTMHELAEYGIAAHWRYKEGSGPGPDPGVSRIAWLRQLLAWQQATGAVLGAEGASTRDDGRIFTLTPQGRIVELPVAATPVDFAYHVHSTLGHRCRGAKVDGRLVPLNTPLVDGQVVEIVTARRGGAIGPSRDWLNPALGFVRSARARTKVRQWFHAQERAAGLATGRERVERALAREGRTALGFEALAQRLALPDVESLFLAVAQEAIGPRALEEAIRRDAADPAAAGAAGAGPGGGPVPGQGAAVPGDGAMARAVLGRTEALPGLAISAPPTAAKAAAGHGVRVAGVDFLLTQLARCCHPAPPDPIVGFVTRGKGVSVHRRDCSAIGALAARAPERMLDVDWDHWRPPVARGRRGMPVDRRYPVAIQVEARDRSGLLRDIGEVLARDRNNVLSVRSQTRGEAARFTLIIEVAGADALGPIFDQIRRIDGRSDCRRI
ncbi:MAG: TGS domain-containing protein [Burkholderiaceae bacterium]